MAAQTTLNAKNLETLGPKRLAELLIEISSGNAAAKRRLRLELAGARSAGELGKGCKHLPHPRDKPGQLSRELG